jgi:hypothetical protein
MSSTYRILCLNHDPAIDIGGEWHSSQDGRSAAAAIALDPAGAVDAAGNAITDGHAGCDLVVGRYSYPLVEVCCPQGRHPGLYHPRPQWVDADWLRLLWHAQQAPEESSLRRAASGSAMACWTPDRLGKLRNELGIDAAPELIEVSDPIEVEALATAIARVNGNVTPLPSETSLAYQLASRYDITIRERGR